MERGDAIMDEPVPMAPIQEEGCHEDGNLNPLDPSNADTPAFNGIANPRARGAGNGGYRFTKWFRSVSRNTKFKSVYGWPSDEALEENNNLRRTHKAETSSIVSSSILRRVRTASISLASLSSRRHPQTNTLGSHRRSGCDSSAFSGSEARMSIDSSKPDYTLDEAAWGRALRRRHIIREMLDTEVSYVASLKALSDILSTMIVTRSGLHRTVNDLLSLHERLLSSLRGLAARSKTSNPFKMKNWRPKRRRSSVKSIDQSTVGSGQQAFTSTKLHKPIDFNIQTCKSSSAEPAEAAAVAEALYNTLPEFTAYGEYGLKYQLTTKEIDMFSKSLSKSQSMDLGIEALVKATAPPSTRQMLANQGLTLSDLLMKPIQRICKYQLFLADLLKTTPVSDCPSSHEMIERALQRLVEIVQEVNRGTGDPVARDRLEKTLLLQDVMDFGTGVTDTRDVLRDFGNVNACGVLHVAYETAECVVGEYMMCALFSTHLLLSIPREDSRKFTVVVILRTADIELRPAEGTSGIQCEDTPFSWKIIFRVLNETFELVMSACSEKEATQWQNQLLKQIDEDMVSQGASDTGRSLKKSKTRLLLKPKFTLVPVDRRPGMERRSTTNACPGLEQNMTCIGLTVKGTEATPQAGQSPNPSLQRSKSFQAKHHTMILTPRRQDRIRMERRLSGIWTRDVIPYPGMQTTKGEYMIRSSAESLLRRFSRRTPFKRLGSHGATPPTVSRKSHEAAPASKDYQSYLEEKDEVTAAVHDAEGEADEKFLVTQSHEQSDKTHKPSSVHMANEEGGIRRNDASLRKRLSMSLFRAFPSYPTIHHAAVAMGDRREYY